MLVVDLSAQENLSVLQMEFKHITLQMLTDVSIYFFDILTEQRRS